MLNIRTIIPILKKDSFAGYTLNQIESTDEFELMHPFISFFHNNKNIIKYQELSNEAKEAVKLNENLSGEIYIPLNTNDKLEYLIIIGKKISNKKYNQKDFALFNTLVGHLLTVIERIRPYEKIKKEFEENQKKLLDAERMLLHGEKNDALMHMIQEYNHEIRTPLSSITVQAQYLEDSEVNTPRKNKILIAAEKINDIVGTTLRLSGESERKREENEINIYNHLTNLIEHFNFPDNIQLVNALSNDNAKIIGDTMDLEMIINNLLKNACEAMPDGGTIRIQNSTIQEFVKIEIKDTGIGIPEDKLQKIWEPFQSRHVTKGRGLGLSIVHRLVKEHGGVINVDSKENEGTSFEIKFTAKN